jgi:hypothetical protein
MTKRRCLLLLALGLAALAVAGIGVVVLLAGPRHRVTMKSVKELRGGMSLQEVEQLLGPANGDPEAQAEKSTMRMWRSEPYAGWVVGVVFSEQEQVANVLLIDTFGLHPMEEGLLDKIRRWLGL